MNSKLFVHPADYLTNQKGSPSEEDFVIMDSSEPNQSSIASISSVAGGTVSSSLDFSLVTKDTHSSEVCCSRLASSNFHRQCIMAFFQHCYNAHPFLLPRDQLLRTLESNPNDTLETAMCYLGSRYLSGSALKSFELEFESYLLPTSAAQKDATMVQAMILFAVGLDGNNNQQRAIEILIKAQSLAVELGMNQRDYAGAYGQGLTVYEESLRRTWWELYIVCVMVAGFHGKATFHLRDVISDVPVPCEEKEFASGVSPV